MTGMEPFVEPIAGGLVGIVFDIAAKVGGGVAEVISDRRQAAQALKRYAEKYLARYGTLKLLGMQKPIKLEEIYTKVRFLDELSIRQFTSLEALERTYREGQKRRFQVQKSTFDGFSVANENQYLMVLGSPGAGKSVYLRRIGVEALKADSGGYQHRCIPVMLELKRFNSGKVDFIQTIADEFSSFGFPSSPDFAVRALEQGKLLVLLDGLDEVPRPNFNSVVDSIQNFVNQYDQNRYIASCRIASHRSTWTRFRDITIADFDDDQIYQFIRNWFSSELDRQTKTAERFWENLNGPKNAAAKELAQKPLILTFLCLVYDRTQNLPNNRAILYRKALDILLEEWAAEKRILHNQIYQGLNVDLEKVLLSEIAYNGFVKNQVFFTEQELVNQIKSFLADTVDKPAYLDGRAVLNAISEQQGVLIERAEGIYSFSDLTFQEYLTAQCIGDDSERLRILVENYLTDQRWREVFLCVSGLVRSADKLLDLVSSSTQKYIYTSKLKSLFMWADQVTSRTESDPLLPARRVVALFLALALAHAINPAFELSLAISLSLDLIKSLKLDLDLSVLLACSIDLDFSPDLYLELEKTKIFSGIDSVSLIARLKGLQARVPDSSQPDQIQQAFATRIYQTWLDALRLQRDWIELSFEETEALTNYLYACELMVECKEAAVRLSEKVWKGIEKQIIAVKPTDIT
ncbi:MAG: NACHT domain-containing protein [Pegethrix bostrychoides GSE-TBD4-15B]|jgi:predicted NACHT family NTPase|uniref:NACHT domain-containing protein n=1 Tax=Pegethrix bostrychoides GSE-TBD4-15B TaxID=2839662 RepID=A0A951PAE1_9CYAN|nr:NACHT domain-containing protein [Pegethrix bostrychoides GSE-TBD4-15B]